MDRFPERALALARAIPPNSPGCLFANSAADWSAGYAIGSLGSNDDIRVRLDGSYSHEFVAGILWAVPNDRSQELAACITTYCRSTLAGSREWSFFIFKFPTQATALAQALFSSPTSHNCAILDCALSTGSFPELERSAFQSNDANLRKIAFRQCESYNLWSDDSNFEIDSNRLIAAANGELPGADDNEQRLAAKALAERVKFKLDAGRFEESSSTLSDEERLLIIKAMNAARDYCAMLGKPVP